MKKILAFAFVLTMAVSMIACGKKEEAPVETPAATPVPEAPAETPVPEEEPAEVEENTGNMWVRQTNGNQVQSYLTGEWVDKSVGDTRPIAYVFNNAQVACPQTGISRSGVIYEAPVEGYMTRLMGVMEEWQDLKKIGSVRSCRDYFVQFALEFDAIYCHYGQAVYALDLLSKDYVNNVSGLASSGAGYPGDIVYYRTSDRKAPHNCYASGEGILKGIDKLGYSMDYDKEYTGKLGFVSEGETADMSGGQSGKVVKPGYPVNKPAFEYNESDGLYYRSQYGGKQSDDMTGKQLAVKNVILQYCYADTRDAKGYWWVDTKTGGPMRYFTDGKVIEGTWERGEDDTDSGRYYDQNGNELLLNQGKTWVCIISATDAGEVRWE